MGVNWYIREKVRTGDRVLTRSYVSTTVSVDPSGNIARVGFTLKLGDDIDFVNTRVGRGGTLDANATLRPTDHLELQLNGSRQWLNVDAGSGEGRLFTAQIGRLKATYNFSSRTFLRLIGQYLDVKRDPALYGFEVPRKSGSFLGSALFSYKVNWQTVLFAGYGDSRVVNERNDLVTTERQFFLKISYAFQR